MIYKFGEFELDRDRFELRRAGAPRSVEPKVFDLLVCLAQSKGRVVTRDELLDQVWSGRIVSDATLSSAVQAARAALDDSGSEQRWIKTARGRGFRFAGEVESIGAEPAADIADAPQVERRLAAILATDACEYSARMERDEQATLAALADVRAIIERRVAEAHGRVFSRAGDGFLAEFQSPVSAVRAGFEIQRDVALARSRNPNALNLRLGVHLADVVVEGDDLLGDGVNIAARIESVSVPGGVTVSQPIFDQVKRGANLTFEELGPTPLKNIAEPIPLFRVLDQIDSHSYMNGANFETAGAQLATEEDPRPSIAVLPFNNLSNDAEQNYFADGFTEDLITELARYRALFVSSRNASLAYRGHNASLAEVGRHLGVEYCLEGSVRRMGSRLRLSVQLSRADTEESIWADRYDSPMEEIFDVQDEIAARIVATVVGRVETTRLSAAKRKRPTDLGAYDCLLRGLEHHRLGGVTVEEAQKAVEWFDKAIAIDPGFARAHAWRSCARHSLGEWLNDDFWEEALGNVRQALELDKNDAEAHRVIGVMYMHEGRWNKARFHFERAMELNPNHANVVARAGEYYNSVGDHDRALNLVARARRLDPFLPAYCRDVEVAALYGKGEYAAALTVGDELQRMTRRAAAYRTAAATHLEDPRTLEETRTELLRIVPGFHLSSFMETEYYKDADVPNRLRADLSAAGLPD